MNNTKTISEILPMQGHYYLLCNGERYARHGKKELNGLLVFANLEKAEQFCMTVGKALPSFQPVRVSIEQFFREIQRVGAICIANGTKVQVASLMCPDTSL